MEWIIRKIHEGLLIRTYLQREHGFSRRMIKSIKFNGGNILVNGTNQNVIYELKDGDKLVVEFPQEKIGAYMEPEDTPLSIVYEDDAVLVLNKAAGMLSIPSLQQPTGTVANALLGHYKNHDVTNTVHIVTRLDRDTSGLMLVAKNSYSHSRLSAFQKDGKVKRQYQAVVEGTPSDKKGVINAPIERKEDSIIERMVREDGKQAITHYEVDREFAHYSLVRIQLETGRTHQIRVHFSYVGHPLVGDTLYGGDDKWIGRQALHCYALSFKHPITNEDMHFQQELPQDMKQLL
ncbi:RluA family pseudouridine synthase [Oceanobacillus picturae]|uniref:RluA family pseudouridine synthase n=1 Tax=Oceanobacillus picturae TaxID=171693 RepID=UPI003626ED80